VPGLEHNNFYIMVFGLSMYITQSKMFSVLHKLYLKCVLYVFKVLHIALFCTDDDFTSAFASAGAEDSTELCAEKDDIADKSVPAQEELPILAESVAILPENVGAHQKTFAEQDSSFVHPPGSLASANLYVSDRDERTWPEVVMAGDVVNYRETVNGIGDLEGIRPTENIIHEQQPTPTFESRNSVDLPLSTQSMDVDPSGRDTSLMSDVTDESTDDTRGESACETSMGDDQI